MVNCELQVITPSCYSIASSNVCFSFSWDSDHKLIKPSAACCFGPLCTIESRTGLVECDHCELEDRHHAHALCAINLFHVDAMDKAHGVDGCQLAIRNFLLSREVGTVVK